MANFCLKDHPRHLGITHHQLISHPSKTEPHLNWQIFFFAESKCQVVTSTIYSKSGLRHFPLTKTHPSTINRICTTPLMRSLRAMRHGRIFPSHSTVKYPRGIPLPGSMRSMMSISAIHALCCTINLEIPTLQMRKIMLPRRSVTRTISVDTGTSCLVIGYGGSRYVLVKM